MKKLFFITVLLLISGAASSQELILVSEKHAVAVYNPQADEMEHIRTEEGRTFIEIYAEHVDITGNEIEGGYYIETLEEQDGSHVFELVDSDGEEATFVVDPEAQLATFIIESRGNIYTLSFVITKAY